MSDERGRCSYRKVKTNDENDYSQGNNATITSTTTARYKTNDENDHFFKEVIIIRIMEMSVVVNCK